MKLFPVDQSWTLFLDRDGVINTRKIGGYIEKVEEFEFLPGVLDALVQFDKQFGRIVVVTNQQGIGKGIMSEAQLHSVHAHMLEQVQMVGGRIDRCYFAPELTGPSNIMRKPNSGMGLAAQRDFPEIDFSKAIMVGDSDSDIEFGIKLGMKTVRIGGAADAQPIADVHVQSLIELANRI